MKDGIETEDPRAEGNVWKEIKEAQRSRMFRRSRASDEKGTRGQKSHLRPVVRQARLESGRTRMKQSLKDMVWRMLFCHFLSARR